MLSLASAILWLLLGLVVVQRAEAIIGGSPDLAPPDAPELRVDANTTESPWAGVGSLTVRLAGSDSEFGTYTATAIDAWHVLTAAHVVFHKAPGDVSFNLNYGGALTHQIVAQEIHVHPEYAGYLPDPKSGVVHDDLAVVRLSSPLPFGVPLYRIHSRPVPARVILTLVGYGASGDGVRGVTAGGAPTIKRVGWNVLDRVFPDNGGSGALEIYLFDFDGPDTSTNRMGGRTLGNRVEATVAGGDSGSPAFVPGRQGAWLILGVNTFVGPQGTARDKFGGIGGGVLLYSYLPWIEGVLAASPR